MYKRDSKGYWIREAVLVPGGIGRSSRSGWSVAVKGETIAISGSAAVLEQTSNEPEKHGVVYLFTRSNGGEWAEEARLSSSGVGENDFFGYSIAMTSDTVFVGNPSDSRPSRDQEPDDRVAESGAIHVFSRDINGDWVESQYIKPSRVIRGSGFGASLSASGERLIVGTGAFLSTHEGEAAYIFERSPGKIWLENAILRSDRTDSSTSFGISVGIDGDLAVVGASSEFSLVPKATPSALGTVYVFNRAADGAWQKEARIKAECGGSFQSFGRRVAIFGETILVGAVDESSNGRGPTIGAGAAFLLQRTSNGVWNSSGYIQAFNRRMHDHFGESVSLSGTQAIIGAWLESSNRIGGPFNTSAPYSGAAYIIDISDFNDCSPSTGIVTRSYRPDLEIAEQGGGYRGNDIFDKQNASRSQTINLHRRVFKTNSAVARLKLTNDGYATERFRFTTAGDHHLGMSKAIYLTRGKNRKNITAAVTARRFRPRVSNARSASVVYRIRTNRFYAGILRGKNRNEEVRFRLRKNNIADNAAMKIIYR